MTRVKHDFYVTFGQKYRTERHPHFPAAHPDGWFRLTVVNYENAKVVAGMLFGEDGYSMIYRKSEFEEQLYPSGELGSWDIKSVMM